MIQFFGQEDQFVRLVAGFLRGAAGDEVRGENVGAGLRLFRVERIGGAFADLLGRAAEPAGGVAHLPGRRVFREQFPCRDGGLGGEVCGDGGRAGFSDFEFHEADLLGRFAGFPRRWGRFGWEPKVANRRFASLPLADLLGAILRIEARSLPAIFRRSGG